MVRHTLKILQHFAARLLVYLTISGYYALEGFDDEEQTQGSEAYIDLFSFSLFAFNEKSCYQLIVGL